MKETQQKFKGVEIEVPNLISPEELTKKAGFKSPMSVYRMVAKGVLPHYRFGRLIRFNLEEVLASTKKHKVN